MPTADTLLATYRLDCATLPPELADEIRDADRACAIADNEVNEAVYRRTLAEERLEAARERADAYIAERNATLLLALHVKLDPDGCPVPRQGAPRGPRQRPADPPPAMQAGEEVGARTSAVEDFYAAVQDRAPAAELEALGWTDETAASLSDVSTRILVKHRITWSDLDTWEDEQPFAFGRAWSMADAARVVA